MKFWGSPLLPVVISASSWLLCAAEFTNSFDYATSSSDINLTWDAVAPHYYPLHITAQVIDKDGDGTKATGYKTNITVGITGNSYKWVGIPYPLRWIPAGLYQIELRTSTWNDNESTVLAKSRFFRILEAPAEESPPPNATQPPSSNDPQGSKTDDSGVNKPLAIGLAVSFGVPALVTLVVVGWCVRRRRQRAKRIASQLKRSDFIIH
ncbi:hypothetical protein QBC37DRAFT_288736 [Rhypophila decipiens]|uniref:Uncharacterized protein n=1 Tax=Rhypophila decipiens TaxID=261697 RepID=A0AAN6Y3Y5_9PEZI|nr:hypothetical protein QBC37DRAFT_288736 [Rhypophila decipiens]